MLVAGARRPKHSFERNSASSSNLARHHWRTTVNMPSIIERLPHELQHIVFSNLDYQSLIYLSTMNRYFQRTVDPQKMSTTTDKAQFVMRAAKDFPQHRPSEKGHDFRPGNFECYICFRVRSPDKFDMLQPQAAFVDIWGCIVRHRDPDFRIDRQVMLRRFCIDCGVNEGIHAPFDCLTTRTGKDLWICRCPSVWSKPACLRCPQCRSSCPLRPKASNSIRPSPSIAATNPQDAAINSIEGLCHRPPSSVVATGDFLRRRKLQDCPYGQQAFIPSGQIRQ